MSNPARRKGTAGENFFLEHVRELHGNHVERAPLKGLHDYGDFVGTPWLVEAKSTVKPLFLAWARICRKKAGDLWILMWTGDKRTKDGKPLVLMPLEMYKALVKGSHLSTANRVKMADLWEKANRE